MSKASRKSPLERYSYSSVFRSLPLAQECGLVHFQDHASHDAGELDQAGRMNDDDTVLDAERLPPGKARVTMTR